jgi:hypothetical protein
MIYAQTHIDVVMHSDMHAYKYNHSHIIPECTHSNLLIQGMVIWPGGKWVLFGAKLVRNSPQSGYLANTREKRVWKVTFNPDDPTYVWNNTLLQLENFEQVSLAAVCMFTHTCIYIYIYKLYMHAYKHQYMHEYIHTHKDTYGRYKSKNAACLVSGTHVRTV